VTVARYKRTACRIGAIEIKGSIGKWPARWDAQSIPGAQHDGHQATAKLRVAA
jgi:hypothetical protein